MRSLLLLTLLAAGPVIATQHSISDEVRRARHCKHTFGEPDLTECNFDLSDLVFTIAAVVVATGGSTGSAGFGSSA